MDCKPNIFARGDGLTGSPATRGTPAQTLTAVIGDAFGGSASVTFSGDWLIENYYDGFDRNISSIDAAGGMALSFFDPGNRAISTLTYGSPGGPTPTDRNGNANVLLASGAARFDEAGRQYETQKDVFLDAAYYTGGLAGLPSGRTVTHTGGGLAANSPANNHTATVSLTAGGTSYVLSRKVFDRRRTALNAAKAPDPAADQQPRLPAFRRRGPAGTGRRRGGVDRRSAGRVGPHP